MYKRKYGENMLRSAFHRPHCPLYTDAITGELTEDCPAMMDIWRYFEDLDEIIYVVDVEDHSVVYMNRYTMKTFKVDTEEEYYGKKCYELLQGFKEPCAFCNTSELEENKFIEWAYRNPVLQKTFMLKDTLIIKDGRKYRMEMAIETRDKLGGGRSLHYESLINDCLIEQKFITDADEGIDTLLNSMGIRLKCTWISVYIQDGTGEFLQSYGWPKKYEEKGKKLNEEIRALLSVWGSSFKTSESIIISNTDNIILIPFGYRREQKGVLKIMNPELGELEDMAEIGRIMSNFVVTLLERRDFVNHLVYLSYHDHLTGALNRNAMKEAIQKIDPDQPVGLVFCDINGLKAINDLKGHQSGDQMIIRVYETLKSVFSDNIYRMGGDEFLVLPDCKEEDEFDLQIQLFRRTVMENNCRISVGTLWKEQAGQDFNSLLREVDERMYEEKKHFYASENLEKRGRVRETPHVEEENLHPFIRFTRNYYFDADTFFKSISSRNSSNYVYCGDMKKNIYYISDSIKNNFKFSDNLVYDFILLLEQRIVEADRQFHIDERKEMIEKKKTWHSIYYRIYDKDGIPVNIHCQGIMKWNEDKTEPLFFSGCMEILDNKIDRENLSVSQYFSQAMEDFRAKADNAEEVLLICVALNNFSVINQLIGSKRGDNIIWEIMGSIRKEFNERIKMVRMTGVRFIIIVKDTQNPDNVIRTIRRAVKQIYTENQISIIYPCSIGILRSPKDGADSDTLLENAEIVMNAAKNIPDVPYVEFCQDMMEEYKSEKELYMELSRCIRNRFENFRIVIQPQVMADTGKIYGGEVLLRWKYKGKDVPPAKFIPILEKNGLIIPVGKWIITQAAETIRQITDIMPDFRMSFNVSYYQVNDDTLFPFIKKTMKLHRISGKNMTIELTETHFNEMPEMLDVFIGECRDLGIGFALDDFGSAYSSLQLLLEYPAEVIKLDREMTKNITSSPDKMNFIMSIIYACHKFGKKICVEGVENEKELEIVRQTGCDFIQGFYFYRPLEKEKLPEVLQENMKKTEKERRVR